MDHNVLHFLCVLSYFKALMLLYEPVCAYALWLIICLYYCFINLSQYCIIPMLMFRKEPHCSGLDTTSDKSKRRGSDIICELRLAGVKNISAKIGASSRYTAGLPTVGIAYGGWEQPDQEHRGHFIGALLECLISNVG